jgi:hypothetical protein
VKAFLFPEGERELRSRVGNVSAIAGAVRYTLDEGQAAGTKAVDVRTGSGLEFTVLPDRGMDISRLSFRGVPLSYFSKTGVAAPTRFEPAGTGWLRGFFGGLLTTCGLSNVGPPSVVQRGEPLGLQEQGLHGRISHIAAEQAGVRSEWIDGHYRTTVSGLMREATAFGESLLLRRRIVTVAGTNSLTIHDVVENDSPVETPFMLLYHINGGYPLVDAGTRLIVRSAETVSRERPGSQVSPDELVMDEPAPQAAERCYFHDAEADENGRVVAAIVNPALEVGLYVKYQASELPYFTSWFSPAAQDYAIGMEPATSLPLGHEEAAARGIVELLPPYSRKEITIEIGVLEDMQAIEDLEHADLAEGDQ